MDDLLDLEWDKKPAGGQSASAGRPAPQLHQPSPLLQPQLQQRGGGAEGGSGSGSTSSYNFDALTRSMPSNVAARSNGSGVGSSSDSASGSPALQSRQAPPQTGHFNAVGKPSSPSAPGSSSSDAFSSLLGGFDSGSKSTANAHRSMTLAERLRSEQANSSAGSSRGPSPLPVPSPQAAAAGADSAWDGLDGFLGASSQTPAATKTKQMQASTRAHDDIWDFTSSTQPPTSARPAAGRAPSSFMPPTQSTRSATKQAARQPDPFDFADFEDPGTAQSSALGGEANDMSAASQTPQASNGSASITREPNKNSRLMDTDRFDSLASDGDDDDDDILGSLGRPARSLASQERQTKDSRAPVAAVPSASRKDVPSPPPHVVGQLVEMGFGPLDAREALSQTQNGQDVQGALELLMQRSDANQRQEPKSSGRSARQLHVQEQREETDRKLAMQLQREEHLQQASGKASQSGRRQAADRQRPDSDNVEHSDTDWQKQADQLYAQASEIGSSVFHRANAFWSQAKAQAQRALDEHSAGGTSGPSSGRASPSTAGGERPQSSRRWAVPSRERKEWQGKPKWMLDAEAAADVSTDSQQEGPSKSSSTFKDDSASIREEPSFLAGSMRQESAAPVARASKQAPSTSGKQKNIWEDDSTNFVASSNGNGPGKSAPIDQQKIGLTPTQSSRSPIPATSSSQLKMRTLVPDSPSAVAASAEHKARGNEHFKRGAYSDAEMAYSAGLSALDTNPASLRRIALLNNRAQAHLKNGNANAALEDTKAVLTLVVVADNGRGSPFLLYRPSREAPLPRDAYAEVNLREGYAKALLRRGQAEEMLEHWETAHSVWSLLEKYEKEEGSGRSGVGNMRTAQDGKARCGKMLNGAFAGSASERATRQTTRAPAQSQARASAAAASAIAKAERAAKERIRAENAAASAEENARDALRDSVDARILGWKAGKENNVRALLASLHDVVWPGLAWKRVGMHELVMDNQVKKVYMRAIGKLHPDKLTPKSNTLEERMVGGAVFAVLNEAWALAQAS